MSLRSSLGVALFVLPLLGAAQVYKSVGPDGKVTYSDSPPEDAAKVESRPGIRARPRRPEEDPVQAALMVYASQVTVETFFKFCLKEVPESGSKVREARDKWHAQHAQLGERKLAILHDRFSVSELLLMARATEQENERVLGIVKRAPQSEKQKWCADAPAKFTSPTLCPAYNPTLVRTIMDYKPKKR
jgi:hypothetical protein